MQGVGGGDSWGSVDAGSDKECDHEGYGLR